MKLDIELFSAFLKKSEELQKIKILFILNSHSVLCAIENVKTNKGNPENTQLLELLLNSFSDNANIEPEKFIDMLYIKKPKIKTFSSVINTNEILINVDSINAISLVPENFDFDMTTL